MSDSPYLNKLNFDKQDGLIAAVVQDIHSHRVLMVGYMNREALEKTLATGHVTFFSRSRQKLWTKGETSGHYLNLKSIQTDCDADALLVFAEAVGPGVCHNGFESCFYRTLQNGEWVQTDQQVYDPDAVYPPAPANALKMLFGAMSEAIGLPAFFHKRASGSRSRAATARERSLTPTTQ